MTQCIASFYLYPFMNAFSLLNFYCACQVFFSFMMPTTSLDHNGIPVCFTALHISVLLT